MQSVARTHRFAEYFTTLCSTASMPDHALLLHYAREAEEELNNHPHSAAAHDVLGAVARRKDAPDEALRHFNQAFDLEPNATRAVRCAYSYALLDQWDASATCLRRILDYDPTHFDTTSCSWELFVVLRVALGRNQPGLAVEVFDAALDRLNPDDADGVFYTALGAALLGYDATATELAGRFLTLAGHAEWKGNGLDTLMGAHDEAHDLLNKTMLDSARNVLEAIDGFVNEELAIPTESLQLEDEVMADLAPFRASSADLTELTHNRERW